jgi:putative tryptophan/tyrosine transport system substrate-binding protein
MAHHQIFLRASRREFISMIIGGAATSWPCAVQAQQKAMRVIGFLDFGSSDTTDLEAFRAGLSETGFVEGRNLAIEYRFANSDTNRLRELAADLVRRRVAVIAAWSSSEAARAVKAATTTIPIVFQTGDDPVEAGLVTSLSRPGGNMTGFTSMSIEIFAKRLQLLHEIAPGAAPIVVLIKPLGPGTELGLGVELLLKAARAAAASIGRQIEVLTANTDAEIETAFASLEQKRVGALLVAPQALFVNSQMQVLTLAAHHAIPASFFYRSFAEAGGLMSYGPKYEDMHRQGGIYVGRILNGEKPADLPVMRPTKFEFVINLKTAKTIGLNVPPNLLAIADEVIE